MRTRFIQTLCKLAEKDPKIFLVCGDLGYSVLEVFAQKFPDRYLNAGVAEQNMMGIAAGLAADGYTPFVYSIANFPTLRCLEQVRDDVIYHGANVKIVAVGGGVAYGSLGYTHHGIEDLGILRTLPEIRILAPGDPIEAELATEWVAQTQGPCYLRIGKAGEPKVHAVDDAVKKQWGKILPVIEASKTTAVLTTGGVLEVASREVKELGYSLYSVPFIRPFDRKGLLAIAKKYSTIVTFEEHQRVGGLGSLVLEELNELYREGQIHQWPKVQAIAIEQTMYSRAGTQDFIRGELGLTLKGKH